MVSMSDLTPKGFSNGQYVDRFLLRDKLYAEDAITMKGVAILNEFPAADVAPVRHGHFGKHTSPFTAPCSECGTSLNTYWHYCPICGADLREETT